MLIIGDGKSGVDYEKPQWMTFYDEMDDPTETRVLVRSSRSKEYQAAQKRRMVKNSRFMNRVQNKIRRGKATQDQEDRFNEKLDRITLETVAEGCIVDWEKVGIIQDGEPVSLECNYENAVAVLVGSQDFLDQVSEFAADPTNYGGVSPEDKELAEGN